MAIMPGFVPKHITIRDDQDKYIKENSLNLSHFIQKKLDEIIGGNDV